MNTLKQNLIDIAAHIKALTTHGSAMKVITGSEITYPDKIICKCGLKVSPSPETIDISSWDLMCKCGKVAYHHPKSEERRQQITDMLLD